MPSNLTGKAIPFPKYMSTEETPAWCRNAEKSESALASLSICTSHLHIISITKEQDKDKSRRKISTWMICCSTSIHNLKKMNPIIENHMVDHQSNNSWKCKQSMSVILNFVSHKKKEL